MTQPRIAPGPPKLKADAPHKAIIEVCKLWEGLELKMCSDAGTHRLWRLLHTGREKH